MNTLPALAALPETLVVTSPAGPDVLRHGLWRGTLGPGVLPSLPGRGRERRWYYGAFASHDGQVAVGAAVVDLGIAGTAFVWALLDGQVVEASRRLWFRHKQVGSTPADGAAGTSSGLQVRIDADGGLRFEVADLGGRRVRAEVSPSGLAPVVCATPTPAGGCNVTQKAAGQPAAARIEVDGVAQDVEGGAWSDWTRGRQDRRTTWRWAAGAGRSEDGHAIGLNASTGMNGAVGEDVAWIDGVPVVLELDHLEPLAPGEPFGGPWRVVGPGWELEFRPVGHRAADENLVVVRSRYVQPVGWFRGVLPHPAGGTVKVAFPGVTEDHEALW